MKGKEDFPGWYKEFRENHAGMFRQALMPPQRYGLSIVIRPSNMDLEKIPTGNAVYSLKYSKDTEAEITQEIANDMKEFMTEKWAASKHKLYHFHEAFANDFILIKIPKGIALKKPLSIDYDIKNGPLLSNICIMAEENSEAKIFITKSSGAMENSFVSDHIRLLAGSNSRIAVVTVQDLGKSIASIQDRISIAGKGASVSWTDLCLGSHYSKADVVSRLEGEGAESKITVLFSGNDNQRYDIYTASVHKAPNTNSDILTKGVLNSQAKGLSRGLVRIEKNAYGSNGYEKQDCLLLSSEAEADAIPNLEINNHDVKCSHGSTIGQIDKEQLFYLMSRGLNEESAKKKIIEGYFAPVLDMMQDQDAREKLQATIEKAIEAQNAD
ncbi:Fe-S cluster assembly protein SufD [Candidatus Woesearchaeota archaeon]|nr:Fe-S cluster assembly protein SufD [Candidatus Woesearchaeota archaeon]